MKSRIVLFLTVAVVLVSGILVFEDLKEDRIFYSLVEVIIANSVDFKLKLF